MSCQCRHIFEILSLLSPNVEALVQSKLAEASSKASNLQAAQQLVFAALRFCTLYPDRQHEPFLSGIENLLLSKVSYSKKSPSLLASAHYP